MKDTFAFLRHSILLDRNGHWINEIRCVEPCHGELFLCALQSAVRTISLTFSKILAQIKTIYTSYPVGMSRADRVASHPLNWAFFRHSASFSTSMEGNLFKVRSLCYLNSRRQIRIYGTVYVRLVTSMHDASGATQGCCDKEDKKVKRLTLSLSL